MTNIHSLNQTVTKCHQLVLNLNQLITNCEQLETNCQRLKELVEMQRRKGADVTKEYLYNATPNEGSINYEQGYKKEAHSDEIDMAMLLLETFGGDITLLAEKPEGYMLKRPDYIWNNKKWELKSAGSAKSIDSLLRKAFQQIHDNPGGVIVDMGNCKDSISRIESTIEERVRKSCRFKIDVIIIRNALVEKIVRYM